MRLFSALLYVVNVSAFPDIAVDILAGVALLDNAESTSDYTYICGTDTCPVKVVVE